MTVGANVSIALMHHPVYDKNRRVITSAVTNLDIHDIARSAKTYGLGRYYIVTPSVEQQVLTERIRRHWLEGWGAGYNPKRGEALALVRLAADLETVLGELSRDFGRPARVVMTGARDRTESVACATMRRLFDDRCQPYLLVFGTGWGLTDEIFARADFVLEPIRGPGAYNHLSVRAAAAITLDRLFGNQGEEGPR